jgi:hypothetical protein
MDGVRKSLVYSAPAIRRILGWVAAIFLVSVTCFFAGIAVLGFMSSEGTTVWVLALVGIVGTGLMGALSLYVLRDLRGKLGLRVAVDEGTIRLNLPAGRSLIHRVPARHVTLPLTAIEAVEARYEAYRSQRMVNLQRAYVLVQKSGERIFLFEDRALATALANSRYGMLAREIAERSGARWRELGMVEGKGGVLEVWGARAPEWGATPLPREQAEAVWQQAAMTGRLAMAGASIATYGGKSGPGLIHAGPTPVYPEEIYPEESGNGPREE